MDIVKMVDRTSTLTDGCVGCIDGILDIDCSLLYCHDHYYYTNVSLMIISDVCFPSPYHHCPEQARQQ